MSDQDYRITWNFSSGSSQTLTSCIYKIGDQGNLSTSYGETNCFSIDDVNPFKKYFKKSQSACFRDLPTLNCFTYTLVAPTDSNLCLNSYIPDQFVENKPENLKYLNKKYFCLYDVPSAKLTLENIPSSGTINLDGECKKGHSLRYEDQTQYFVEQNPNCEEGTRLTIEQCDETKNYTVVCKTKDTTSLVQKGGNEFVVMTDLLKEFSSFFPSSSSEVVEKVVEEEKSNTSSSKTRKMLDLSITNLSNLTNLSKLSKLSGSSTRKPRIEDISSTTSSRTILSSVDSQVLDSDNSRTNTILSFRTKTNQ